MDLLERRQGTPRRHPWETARVEVIKSIIERLGLRQARVLDVGCGDGYAVTELQRSMGFREALGQDPHLTDALIDQLSTPVVRFVRDLGAASGEPVDLVLLLDVLEHVEDPVGFLERLAAAHLAPTGWVIVTVPAFQALFSNHDRKLRHFRRYTRPEIVDVIAAAGLDVVDSGYFFASLLVPRALSCLAGRLFFPEAPAVGPGIGDWRGSMLLTKLLHHALCWDQRLGLIAHDHGLTLPGLSVWLTCRKPS